MTRLEVTGLSIAANKRLLVENVSFRVEAGSVHAVLGESGSGKTMTMLAILGLLPPGVKIVAGSIVFCRPGGEKLDLAALSEADWRALRGREISAVFQNPLHSLNPRQRVGRAMEELLVVRGGMNRKIARDTAAHWFHELKIMPPDNRYAAYPGMLSGGLLQRVAIAMAASLEPALVIADEPTSALDANLRNRIADLFAGLPLAASRPSVLFVTHDPGLALRIAPSATLLRRGRQEGSGDLAVLTRENPYARFLFGASPRLFDTREFLPEWEEALSAL